MSDKTIHCAIKVRIVKPIDRDWNDVGPRLRELSWIAHRVLNGTMTRLAVAAELPELVPDEWKSRRNETSIKRPGGKPSAYQMTSCAIDRANEERVKSRPCKWCAGSGVEPTDAPIDKSGKPIKRAKKQPERGAGEACSRCDGAREFAIGSPVDVPSAIQAGWQRMADRRHANDRADVLRGAKSIASYRSPAPIAVTSSGEAFRVWHDGRGYVLDAPLFPGGEVGRVSFAIAPDGRGAHEHLRRMVGGAAKLGDLKILAPHGAKKKWLAAISYSFERETIEAGSGPDAIVRLAADGSPEIVTAGRRPRRLYEGESIAHKRRAFAARRASRSKHQRDIGAGARGHGRARALEHYHAIDDAERRWITSICQEIASKAVREARLRGARWVTVDESVAKALPPATLRGALDWALQRAGIEPPTSGVEPAKTLPQSIAAEGVSV